MISFVVALFNVVNALVCPGNEMRKLKGIEINFPKFYETSFVDKLRICIASTVEHFTSIPDAVFITFSLLLGVLCLQTLKGGKKYVGWIPGGIALGLNGYFFVVRVIRQHTLSYLRPDVNACEGSAEYTLQWVMTFFGVVYLVAVLWSLYQCCGAVRERVFVMSTYCIGLASRFVLVFSPTMIASGTRVFFYFYMAMILCIGRLMERVNSKKIRKLLWGILLLGGMMNLVTVVWKGNG